MTLTREQLEYQARYELVVKITQCNVQFQQTMALIEAHDAALRQQEVEAILGAVRTENRINPNWGYDWLVNWLIQRRHELAP